MSFSILLVDDDALVRESLKRVLEQGGIKVTAVCCVEDAKEALGHYLFSAVVSDVRMPDGTGVDLYKWVVEHRQYLMHRFIFCSGGLPIELESYIGKSGCRLFKKPIDGKALIEAIHAVRSPTSQKSVTADGASIRGL